MYRVHVHCTCTPSYICTCTSMQYMLYTCTCTYVQTLPLHNSKYNNMCRCFGQSSWRQLLTKVIVVQVNCLPTHILQKHTYSVRCACGGVIYTYPFLTQYTRTHQTCTFNTPVSLKLPCRTLQLPPLLSNLLHTHHTIHSTSHMHVHVRSTHHLLLYLWVLDSPT